MMTRKTTELLNLFESRIKEICFGINGQNLFLIIGCENEDLILECKRSSFFKMHCQYNAFMPNHIPVFEIINYSIKRKGDLYEVLLFFEYQPKGYIIIECYDYCFSPASHYNPYKTLNCYCDESYIDTSTVCMINSINMSNDNWDMEFKLMSIHGKQYICKTVVFGYLSFADFDYSCAFIKKYRCIAPILKELKTEKTNDYYDVTFLFENADTAKIHFLCATIHNAASTSILPNQRLLVDEKNDQHQQQ